MNERGAIVVAAVYEHCLDSLLGRVVWSVSSHFPLELFRCHRGSSGPIICIICCPLSSKGDEQNGTFNNLLAAFHHFEKICV